MQPFVRSSPSCSSRLALRVFAVLLVASVTATLAGPANAERWTSLSGSHTVNADFVGLWGNQVVLELPGQRRVAVELDNLIAESRIQARRLAEQNQQRRSETKEQILAEAEEAAAPAPTPLPQPPEAPAYSKLTPGGGVLDQLDWVEQQKRNGHALLAVFDSLPPSYQSDVERLVQTAAQQKDLQGLRQTLTSLQSVGELIVTRQRWFFSHPRFYSFHCV